MVDLDTLYKDLTLLVTLWLLWRRRRTIGDRLPFVVFCGLLSLTTVVLLGYVVTNFGTLWRMRPLIGIPLWVALAVLAATPHATRARSEADHPTQFRNTSS